jgi:hypothetical protein
METVPIWETTVATCPKIRVPLVQKESEYDMQKNYDVAQGEVLRGKLNRAGYLAMAN